MNTQILVGKAIAIFKKLEIESKIIRAVDHNISFRVALNKGAYDKLPLILEQIKACNICVISNLIWFGVFSSVAKTLIQRLNGTSMERIPESEQYPPYGRVARIIVAGNEKRGLDVCSTIFFCFTHLEYTISRKVDYYLVGGAVPGPSYTEAGRYKHLYASRTSRYMAYNLLYFAKLLKETPISASLKKLDEEAKQVSY